ncbi:MAG: helix-turn-helix domain-containing protein [Pseudonocardiaceae bacterium]
MSREPEDLAELRRGLGAQLAVYRTAAELTQDQLAKAAFRDRTTVAPIEKGRHRGDERFWRIADDFCGAQGALLAAFHAVAVVQQAHGVQIREAQLAESQATAQALRLTLRREIHLLALPTGDENVTSVATPAGTVDGDPRPETVEDQAVKRREAIALAATISVGAGLTAADRAVLDAPVTASPVPNRIGASDVARVQTVTRSLMAQDKALGGSCRDAVFGHLSWAQQLRKASASDDVRRALEAALARLESLAGWTSYDLCLSRTAQRCYLRSLESARRAEEPVLAAHALGTLGGLYLQAEHFPEALQLFRLGALPALDVASPGMLTALALAETKAYASLGNVDDVQRALRRAEEHYARAQEAPVEWVISAAVLPDNSDFPADRAVAYSRLAEHDPRFAEIAVTDMTEALTLRDPGRARAMLSGRIILATNQYRCGETDLANTTTGQVLAAIDQVSSLLTARKLTALGTKIPQYTTDSTALDLAHRISTNVAT